MREPAAQWLDERFKARTDAAGTGPGRNLNDRFQAWRLHRLAEVIEWAAADSPWYRARFKRGAPEEAAAALRDLLARAAWRADGFDLAASRILGALPSPAAADLAADSGAFLAVGHSDIEGVVSVPSSGTSGPAKRLCSTAGDLEETVRFFEYGMRFLVSPGSSDRVALAMSQPRPGNVADLLGRAMHRLGLNFEAFGFLPEGRAEEEEEWIQRVADFQPTCLVGVPPQMLSLARHRLGERLKASLRAVLLSGDVASPRLVSALSDEFQAAVYRHYGLTETGLGGAVECHERQWPHPRDDLWVEILDARGRPVAKPEDFGEIAITTLTRRAMPLIRYRTGDEGRLLPSPCPCGSILPRLETRGRLDDHIILRNGRKLRAADFEEPLLPLKFVRSYDLKIKGEELLISIIPGPGPPPEGLATARNRVVAWLGPSADCLQVRVENAAPAAGQAPARLTGKRRLTRS